MNTGIKQDMAIHQPDKIFTAGDARDIHFVVLVGRKFLLLMRINPLAWVRSVCWVSPFGSRRAPARWMNYRE